MNNQDFLDFISVLSFVYGVKNYEENLTQTDKAEIMQKLDEKTTDILNEIREDIKSQNELLKKIYDEVKRR